MHLSRRPLQAKSSWRVASSLLASQPRYMSASRPRYAQQPANPPPAEKSKAVPAPAPAPKREAPPSPLADAPRATGRAVQDFTPTPLSRPIGLSDPPAPGQNTGLDHRTWKERRDDFVDYDKHIERRKQLTKKISTPYFRDWTNMRFHQGKTFLAPPGLFKADRSLYFPNLYGRTLDSKQGRDTTPLFLGKVTVVSIYSSSWAENQAATFAGKKENPELHQVLNENKDLAQLVRINVEENAMKAALVKFFMPGVRKNTPEEEWGRNFLVQKGLSDEIRESIGILNGHVGYTYLLDQDCQIRWAGSGPAEEDEKIGLVKGLKRLVNELRAHQMADAELAAKQVTDSAENVKLE